MRHQVARSVHSDSRIGHVIQTRYAGRFFRSRLEARWCVLFENLRLHWEYEVEGYRLPSGLYLPDFYIPEWSAWIEIKPSPVSSSMSRICRLLAELRRTTGAKRAFAIFGAPDLIRGSEILNERGSRIATHLDERGPTNEAPFEGIAYQAYRAAMEERF